MVLKRAALITDKDIGLELRDPDLDSPDPLAPGPQANEGPSEDMATLAGEIMTRLKDMAGGDDEKVFKLVYDFKEALDEAERAL